MNKYYLELTTRWSEKVFRLQKDQKSWSVCRDGNFGENDFLTTDADEIISLQKKDHQFIIDGKTWKVREESFFNFFDEDQLHYRVRIKRESVPDIPRKNQLISVISKGNEEITNVLILNDEGKFELRDFLSLDWNITDPTIVLRYLTSVDVGIEASEERDIIDLLYALALQYWAEHLKSGRTNYCTERAPAQRIEESLKTIEEERKKYTQKSAA